jgi:hypothetical protein
VARRSGLAQGGRRLRLGESLALAGGRRLQLVRCDGHEWLLLTGGARDLVVAASLAPCPAGGSPPEPPSA